MKYFINFQDSEGGMDTLSFSFKDDEIIDFDFTVKPSWYTEDKWKNIVKDLHIWAERAEIGDVYEDGIGIWVRALKKI